MMITKRYYVPNKGKWAGKIGELVGDIDYKGCWSGWHTLEFVDGTGLFSGDEVCKYNGPYEVIRKDGELIEVSKSFAHDVDILKKALDKISILERALIDILDGNSSPIDIHNHTGLNLERCEEISSLFADITK